MASVMDGWFANAPAWTTTGLGYSCSILTCMASGPGKSLHELDLGHKGHMTQRAGRRYNHGMGATFRRLGELLLEDGAVTVSELHTALEACKRSGGRLGTHLLRLGYVPEAKLLKALARQFGVQPVTSDHLVAESAKLQATIPIDVQTRLKAVPFEQHGRVLSVAMVNPRDLAAREELERLSGLHVEPFVASERAIRLALDASGSWTRVEDGDDELESLEELTDASESWEVLWKPPAVRTGALRRALNSVSFHSRPATLAAFPSLVEIRGEEFPPMTREEFRTLLRGCRQRDEVGELLVAFARQYLGRVVLLAVQRDNVSGWLGGGREISLEDVQALNLPLGESAVLRSVAIRGRLYTGELGGDPGARALAEVLGPPPPVEVVAAPLRIGNRTVAILLGDQPDGGMEGVPVTELRDAATRAGLALEILILTRKI